MTLMLRLAADAVALVHLAFVLFLAALADVNRGRNSGGRPRWVRRGG